MRKNRLFWILLTAIVLLNVIPLGNDTSKTLSGKSFGLRLDYLIHLTAFLGFGGVYIYGMKSGRRTFENQEWLKSILIILPAAAGVELIQHLLPYRSFNPLDLLANLAGALLSALVIGLVGKRSS